MATCPICLYQQNMAGVEPPIFVEEIPALRPSFVWKNVALDAVRWQNHGVLRSTCGPPWDHTFFPNFKIMTRWDENVTCSLRCIAYACYRLPFLECNRSNISKKLLKRTQWGFWLATYREYVMQSWISPPLHVCPKPSCFVACRLWRPKPRLNSGKKRRPASIGRNICFNKQIDKTSKMMAEYHENGSSKKKWLQMDNYKWGPTSSMDLFRVVAGLPRLLKNILSAASGEHLSCNCATNWRRAAPTQSYALNSSHET